MKYSKRELFSIRWDFRENRKGVFNFYRKLKRQMNLLNDDSELYTICKQNSLPSSQHFSIDIIGQQWIDLMQFNH